MMRIIVQTVIPSEEDYNILLQRYKELSKHTEPPEEGGNDITFTVDPYLSEQNTGIIDNDYMNSRFEKWQKQLYDPNVSKEEREATLEELHKSFAMLSQEEQKYANIFLHDLQRGDVFLKEGKTFRDYITDYQFKAKNDQIHRFAEVLGLDEEKLRTMMDLKLTESTIDEFGRLEVLKATKDKDKVKAYLSAVIKPFREKIECINKINLREEEYLKICLKGETISFPFFREGTMYKGMEVNKRYTLEELGL